MVVQFVYVGIQELDFQSVLKRISTNPRSKMLLINTNSSSSRFEGGSFVNFEKAVGSNAIPCSIIFQQRTEKNAPSLYGARC